MVTTVSPYSSPRNRAYPGEGLDGVMRVSYNGASGTGVLLCDALAVLTAAHLFANGTTAVSRRSSMVALPALPATPPA